jgi:hypothetical protein
MLSDDESPTTLQDQHQQGAQHSSSTSLSSSLPSFMSSSSLPPLFLPLLLPLPAFCQISSLSRKPPASRRWTPPSRYVSMSCLEVVFAGTRDVRMSISVGVSMVQMWMMLNLVVRGFCVRAARMSWRLGWLMRISCFLFNFLALRVVFQFFLFFWMVVCLFYDILNTLHYSPLLRFDCFLSFSFLLHR